MQHVDNGAHLGKRIPLEASGGIGLLHPGQGFGVIRQGEQFFYSLQRHHVRHARRRGNGRDPIAPLHVGNARLHEMPLTQEIHAHHVGVGKRPTGQAGAIEKCVDRARLGDLDHRGINCPRVSAVHLEEIRMGHLGLLDIHGHNLGTEFPDDPGGRFPHARETTHHHRTLLLVAKGALHGISWGPR